MTPDDLLESNSYFVRPEFRPEAKQQAEPDVDAPPVDRRKELERIAADSAESVSARQDARRLLEVAATRPRDFEREYRDFMAWRNEQ
jgi:hypothetical protein